VVDRCEHGKKASYRIEAGNILASYGTVAKKECVPLSYMAAHRYALKLANVGLCDALQSVNHSTTTFGSLGS
jgi:hypothetical protein